MLEIRRFAATDADYEAAVALDNADFPDSPQTVEEWKFFDSARNLEYYFERFLGEMDGRAVALGQIGHIHWAYEPDKYYIMVRVSPDQRGLGFEDQLYDFLAEHLKQRGAETFMGKAREDQTYLRELWDRKGYEQVMRYPTSKLDVVTFDFQRFEPVLKHVQAAGIWIGNLEELAALEPDWQRKLYDLDWVIDRDVPSPEPVTRNPFDVWLKWITDSPTFMAQGFFVARDGDELVGLTSLWKTKASKDKLYTGLTGVVRSHRRRHIATALKTRAIQYARSYGAREVETDNEENNPMYFLNLQLGFKPAPAFLDYRKILADDVVLESEDQFALV